MRITRHLADVSEDLLDFILKEAKACETVHHFTIGGIPRYSGEAERLKKASGSYSEAARRMKEAIERHFSGDNNVRCVWIVRSKVGMLSIFVVIR